MKKELGHEAIYDARQLGTPRMLILGLQHMFAMFGATVLVPLLTGLSVYDDLAKIAGAGTLVPITGFANAVVSPAIEFKAEVRCIIGIVRENRNR